MFAGESWLWIDHPEFESPQSTMNIKLINYAKVYGVIIEERNATGSYIWNGKTIANHYNKWNDWDGLFKKEYFPDEQLAHEIAHWIVAKPWQRELPEYGMNSLTGFGCLENFDPVLSKRDWSMQEKYAAKKGYIIFEKCK